MPSKKSQGMLHMIRAHKRLVTGLSNSVMHIDPPIERVARSHIVGTSAEIIRDFPMPALMVTPRETVIEDACILHLHGGAYMSGGLLQCRVLIGPICAFSGVRAMTFSYRLTPEHIYPAQLEDALQAYQYLLSQGYSADRIVLVGESAGGNLALSLTRRLRDEGRPLPAGLALLSPWADLAQTGESYRALRNEDATLDPDELLAAGIAFAGGPERLTDPDISPLYADFHGFPPAVIHCGTKEILLSDSENLEKRMLEDGVNAHLIRWEGMCHVFQAFGFEESRASNMQLGAFVRACLEGKLPGMPENNA